MQIGFRAHNAIPFLYIACILHMVATKVVLKFADDQLKDGTCIIILFPVARWLSRLLMQNK